MPATAATELANVVCFASFADNAADNWENDRDYYDRLINDDAPGANSVYSYFRDASYGALDWRGILAAGEYTDTNDRDYYCKKSSINPDGYTEDLMMIDAQTRLHKFVAAAASYAETVLPPDALLDGNNDGVVDNFTIVIKGNSDISASRLLWPQNNRLIWAQASIHGKKVSNFFIVFDSANGYQSLRPTPLNTGVMCHEMMHTFDAYDLYTNGSAAKDLHPVGIWDLMSDNQVIPQGMTAYTRMTYGHDYGNWIPEVGELTADGTYTVAPLDSPTPDNVTYKIRPDMSREEYFMVEYRRKSNPWDASLPGEGLLVYRVNPGKHSNLSNSNEKFELYIFRPGGTPTSAGSIADAAMHPSAMRTSFGADSDTDYPFYSDASRAPFSITDVTPVADGMQFTLTLTSAALSATTLDTYPLPRYNPATRTITAPSAISIAVFSIDGRAVTTLDDAKSGVYVAHVTYPDGTTKTLKFVI